jgi:hypothetical protein
MKRILTILALVAFTLPSGVATQQANAQIDKSPGNWSNYPTRAERLEELTKQRIAAPPTEIKELPNAETTIVVVTAPTLPAHITLPPAKYDGPYRGGQLIVTKWNDYSLIQHICKDVPNAVACSYKTYETATGKLISCLIMLGPAAHNNERVLRHETGHCNGWSDKHEGAR